jgi:glycosyltransferase involved in cell wall biosynthesis
MITYNHEQWIGTAIESVLAQDYGSWELVIGEDCSTDGTLDIAKEYASSHPDKIRVLETPENLGGRANFLRTLGDCRGEFVALLDGDDYWTDPRKLALGVEHLDREPECAMVFSACEQVSDDPAVKTRILRPSGKQGRYTQEDLIWGNLAASASILWRRPRVEDLPGWFMDVPVGDWPLHMLVAERGWIGYIDRVMCAHRVHGAGVWAGMSAVKQLDLRITVRRFLRDHLGDRVDEIARAADLRDHFRIARTCASTGDRVRAAREFRWCFENRMAGRKPHPIRSLWGWGMTRLKGLNSGGA